MEESDMSKPKDTFIYKGKEYRKVKRIARLGELILVTDGDGHGIPVGTISATTYVENRHFGCDGWVRIKNKLDNSIRNDQYVVLEPVCKEQITDTWCDEMTYLTKEQVEKMNKCLKDKKGITAGDIRDGTDVEWFTFSDSHPAVVVPPKYKKRAEKFYNPKRNNNDWLCGDCGHWNSDKVGWCVKCHDEHNHPKKRVWTDAEIQEAKRYVADKMYGLTIDNKFILFHNCKAHLNQMVAQLFEDDGTCDKSLYADNNTKVKANVIKTAIATCCPTDTFQVDIGKMIAVCKLFNEPYPSWMKDGSK
jgi:hypothetical protein